MKLFSLNKYNLKWILIAFAIKIPLFIYFAIQFKQNWPAHLVENNLFVYSGDTWGYYDPCENFVNGMGYTSYCRMPGLLPIYFLFRPFLNITWTKTCIIILQFIASTLSVYILARIAFILSKHNHLVFKLTFFIYAISSFVSIWSHVGYSDSFGVSFLIFSFYFLLKFKDQYKINYLILSSVFITWSVFFRPIHGVCIPVFIVIYLFDYKKIGLSIKHTIIFTIPLIISLSVWTVKNYQQTNKIIILQGPLSECFPSISDQLLAIRKLIACWGDDVQPWAKDTAGEWFFSKKMMESKNNPSHNNIYTKDYNLDSLITLRKKYFLSIDDSIEINERQELKQYVIDKSNLYVESYKKEFPIRAGIINKLILLKQLLIPNRLDDLPFPKFNEMNILQKTIKLGYYSLLILINTIGFVVGIFFLFKKNYLVIIPISLITVLIIGFGIVEQRYLLPTYPFFVILTSFFVSTVVSKLKNSF